MTIFCLKIKTPAGIFRPLSAFLISTTVGLFLSQGILWPKPAFSAGFKPNIFESKFGASLNAFSSERLRELLVIPHYDSGMPFWRQIGNPHRITQDLEAFYNTFNAITLNEIKENYFHIHLRKIRDFEFLKLYFNEKFNGARQDLTPNLYISYQSPAVY